MSNTSMNTAYGLHRRSDNSLVQLDDYLNQEFDAPGIANAGDGLLINSKILPLTNTSVTVGEDLTNISAIKINTPSGLALHKVVPKDGSSVPTGTLSSLNNTTLPYDCVIGGVSYWLPNEELLSLSSTGIIADAFGATPDFDNQAGTGTDNVNMINAAISYAEASGVGTTFLLGGGTKEYAVSNAVVLNNSGLKTVDGQVTLAKTTNNLSGLPSVPSPEGGTTVFDVDAVVILVHEANRYANTKRIENIRTFFSTNAGASKGTYGFYCPYWNSFTVESCFARNAVNGFYGETQFLGTFSRSEGNQCDVGFKLNSNGTSLNWVGCYTNSCAVGYQIRGSVYSSMTACASDSATGVAAYDLQLCRGFSLNGCGAEFAESQYLINFNAGSYSINGFDTFNLDMSETSFRLISGARVVANAVEIRDFNDPTGKFNISVNDGSKLIDTECIFPTNASAFNAYTNGASRISTKDGTTTHINADGESSIGPLGINLFASNSDFNTAAGNIDTGLGRKPVNIHVKMSNTATDAPPTVFPVVTAALSNGIFTVRFYDDPGFTIPNFAAHNIDWIAY